MTFHFKELPADANINVGARKITPHLPIWRQDGATVQQSLADLFTDRNGNNAVVTTVYWTDKKGKHHETVHTVKWITD